MKTIFYFELRKWLTAKAVWFTLIAWCIIIAFCTKQRSHAIQVIVSSRDTAAQYEAQKAAEYAILLDSVEKGQKQIAEWSADPRNPVVYNRSVPKFALFKAGPLDLFAMGQSDVQRHSYVISSRYD